MKLHIITPEVIRMKNKENRPINAVKQPLPDDHIAKNALHSKGHFDIINNDDLPIEVLEKEIPASKLHDM